VLEVCGRPRPSLLSSEYLKKNEAYKVRFWNDFRHLTLPEGRNGKDGEIDCCGMKLVWPFKERRLGILNNVGYPYPRQIRNPRRGIQRLVGHEDRLSLDLLSFRGGTSKRYTSKD
jgi:hypothetical protein